MLTLPVGDVVVRTQTGADMRVGVGLQVYGAVTMNNTMCLGLFLLVIYLKGLPWDYSSEVIVTVGV